MRHWDSNQTRWADPIIVDNNGGADKDRFGRSLSCTFDPSTNTLGVAYLKFTYVESYNPTPTVFIALCVPTRC